MRFRFQFVCLIVSMSWLTACQSLQADRDNALFIPVVGGDEKMIANTSVKELTQLQLISTNLVSALVQIPEMKVGATTLQFSNPTTAFGSTLLRALEDAGFGLQRVTADQGLNYITYGKRVAETESGMVTDYGVAIGDIEVRREYEQNDDGVFPSSLLLVSGTDSIVDITLDEAIFTEQGGSGSLFISGVGGSELSSPTTDVSTITVNDYDVIPIAKRADKSKVLSDARLRFYSSESQTRPHNLEQFAQLRRTVLIFENKESTVMGRGNKQAIGLLADTFQPGDVFAIGACNDVDGKNDASQYRAVRVEEEFVSHGVEQEAVQIEPCVRASYRHSSDDAPVAVTVVQYRNL